MLGIHHPDRFLSLTAAGAGSGSERGTLEEFRETFRKTADEFEKHGSEHVVKNYGMGAARIPFLVKDPRGFAEFNEHVRLARSEGLGQHAARLPGRAAVALRLRGRHPKDQRCRRLIVVGDEDDPCLEPSLFLKQWILTSGLVVFPKTGHVVNQEEPALFNEAVADFIARVEAGRWPERDPRSIRQMSGRTM